MTRSLKLYADDVKLYSKCVLSSDAVLQDYLNHLAKWASDWQLPVSYAKCCIVNMENSNNSETSWSIGNQLLDTVCNVKDLGVYLDNKWNFSGHVNQISNRAHRRASLIHRCFQSKDLSSLIAAFKVYVRPILEFNSIIWNPFLIRDINCIEQVQRRFTKRLP